MNAKQLGHRAAAWGTPRDEIQCGEPLPTFVKEMHAAYDAVKAHQAKGLDPNGHTPRIPHLCERTVSDVTAAKVCNCCSVCSTACWAEGFEGTSEKLRATAKGLLRKILPKGFPI